MSGSVGCNSSITVPYGTTVSITASWPWEDRFGAWQGGGCAGSGTCTLTLTSNDSVSAPFSGYFETTGSSGVTEFTATNESGKVGQVYGTQQVACQTTGTATADGNNHWYRLTNGLYVPADPFYNNGATSGALSGTPFVDNAVQGC